MKKFSFIIALCGFICLANAVNAEIWDYSTEASYDSDSGFYTSPQPTRAYVRETGQNTVLIHNEGESQPTHAYVRDLGRGRMLIHPEGAKEPSMLYIRR